MTDSMIRVDRKCHAALKDVCGRHPLRPSIKSAMERAIWLMIEDMEVEIENANK